MRTAVNGHQASVLQPPSARRLDVRYSRMVKRSDARHAILAAGLLVTLAALACRAPVRPYVCAVDTQAVGVDVDVHSVWTCNRKVLYRAARKKAFSLREFREAAAFFEQLIDFQVDTQPSHLGVLPG